MIKILRVGLAGTLLLVLVSCSANGDKFAKVFPSPARDFDAVLVSEAGGGPGSSYCIDTIFVVPSKMRDSGAYRAEDRAYVGGCHLLKMMKVDGRASMPNAPQVRWTGPYELSIE